MTNPRLAVIGGGNMAQAILRGAIDTGVIQPNEILVADPEQPKRDLFQSWGANAVTNASELNDHLATNTQIMLAVKPQFLADAARDLGGAANGRTVISILAGSTSARIQDAVGPESRIIRVMPNLPSRIREGITAMALGAGATTGDDKFARQLFESVGDVVTIDESLMDAFTAIAGSGPAYVFYLAEAMHRAACDIGFDNATALHIVRKTVSGAASLLNQSDETPAELRAAVTSKKGTTDAAITSMDRAGVMAAVMAAAVAARDRGVELSSL